MTFFVCLAVFVAVADQLTAGALEAGRLAAGSAGSLLLLRRTLGTCTRHLLLRTGFSLSLSLARQSLFFKIKIRVLACVVSH